MFSETNKNEKDKQTNVEEPTTVNKINDFFKIPLYYNKEKVELKKNIITDLELVETIDPSCSPIYSFCFNNDNDVSKIVTKQISTHYTTDTHFLKDSQKLIKEYVAPKNKYTGFSPNYKNII